MSLTNYLYFLSKKCFLFFTKNSDFSFFFAVFRVLFILDMTSILKRVFLSVSTISLLNYSSFLLSISFLLTNSCRLRLFCIDLCSWIPLSKNWTPLYQRLVKNHHKVRNLEQGGEYLLIKFI